MRVCRWCGHPTGTEIRCGPQFLSSSRRQMRNFQCLSWRTEGSAHWPFTTARPELRISGTHTQSVLNINKIIFTKTWAFVLNAVRVCVSRQFSGSNVSVNVYPVNEPWLYSLMWCSGVHSVSSDAPHILKKVPNPIWIMVLILF